MALDDLLGREHEVADTLRASNSDMKIEDLLTEDEKNDYKFIAAVNALVMRCSACNRWVALDETDDEGNCFNC